MRADASTEVPIVVFSDVVRVPGREKTEYERLPEYPDESRVEVTVADGPSDTYYSSSGFGGIYVTI